MLFPSIYLPRMAFPACFHISGHSGAAQYTNVWCWCPCVLEWWLCCCTRLICRHRSVQQASSHLGAVRREEGVYRLPQLTSSLYLGSHKLGQIVLPVLFDIGYVHTIHTSVSHSYFFLKVLKVRNWTKSLLRSRAALGSAAHQHEKERCLRITWTTKEARKGSWRLKQIGLAGRCLGVRIEWCAYVFKLIESSSPSLRCLAAAGIAC